MKKKLLISLLVFIGGIFTFIACQGPELFGLPEGSEWKVPVWNNKNRDRDAIAEARQWYNLHREETEFMVTRGGKYSLFKDMEPAWKQCYTRKTNEFTSIESGIKALGGIYLVTPDCEQRFKTTGDKRYLVTQTRLIILKYKDGRDMIGFFMTLSPSAKYLEMTKFRPFYSTYAQREKLFDGYVYYHDMQGRFVNGWKYTDGKVTHALSPQNDSQPQTRSSTLYCIPVYEFECETEGSVNEEGEVVIQGDCDYYLIGESCIQIESTEETDNNTNNEGPDDETGYIPNLPGGNNNNGNGEYLPPQKNDQTGMSPELKALFKNQTIGQEGIKKLNAALAEVLQKKLFKTIYDYVVSKGGCHTIKYQSNMIGLGSIALEGSTIHLKFVGEEHIERERLEHEMYHMFQVYNNGITQATLGKYRGMMEFEQELFQNIQKYREVKEDWVNIGYRWACWEYSVDKNEHKDEYMLWLKKLTNTGKNYPATIDIGEFKSWSKIYGKISTRYNIDRGFLYEVDSYPITMTDVW